MKKYYNLLYFIAIPMLSASMFMDDHPFIMLGLVVTGFCLLGGASYYYTASGDEQRDDEHAKEQEAEILRLKKEIKIIEDKTKDLNNDNIYKTAENKTKI